MSCEQIEPMMTAYLDGELAPERREQVASHLEGCERCRGKLQSLSAVKEDLAVIKFKEPSDVELAKYWRSIYNRLERGIGWILFSVGAIVLLCYGAFRLIERVIRDANVALAVKAGIVALVFGAVILFVSVLRERLAVRKTDRYSKEVER